MALHEEERPDAADDDFEIEPSHESDLLRELHALRAMSDAQGRGYMLEALLERMFRRAHFQVVHNPKMAGRRQTDFAVISHDHRYLVEAKWEGQPAGTDVVQAVRSRLRRVDGTVVALLFTMSGIAEGVDKEIAEYRGEGLVLVFDDADILTLLRDPHESDRLLRLKRDALVVHGRVHRGEKEREAEKTARRSRKKAEQLPRSRYRLLDAGGDEVLWFHGAGGFNPAVFCLDLPDVDWVPAAGSGVCLDMPVAAWGQHDLLRLLDSLNELGWMGDRGQWSIQQNGRNWHGCGVHSFTEALKNWRERTRELEKPHHSEEFVYFEACDGGFYTVCGNISAERTRRVARCNVSFQLVGMPLDPGSLQQLYRRFDVPSRGYFRPLVEQSVTRRRFDGRVPLQVLGRIVESGDQRWDQEDWVVGLLAANPYRDSDLRPPDDLASDLEGAGVLVCDLRSHHPLSKPKGRYELWSYERARTSDAHALRIVADWWEPEDNVECRPSASRAGSGYFGAQFLEVAAQDPAPAWVASGTEARSSDRAEAGSAACGHASEGQQSHVRARGGMVHSVQVENGDDAVMV
ncbi:restriction endonuclease [Streptomyces sp. NPDC052101]|uniref:restriction endonuclease n=1 Tax=Streptomyces sp. NPDC052101 TaxID=3155763 RepID=UPI003429B0C7